MRLKVFSSFLLTFTTHVYADCPALDGDWFISTATNPAAVRAAGFKFGSSQFHVTISGSSVVLNSGIGLALSVGNQVTSLNYNPQSTGTVTQNPANCRLHMSVIISVGSTGIASTSTFRGDYVKVTKGYAGKANGNSGGVVTPGTFEMTRE